MKMLLILSVVLILLFSACGSGAQINHVPQTETTTITVEDTIQLPELDPTEILGEIVLCDTITVFERELCLCHFRREVWLRDAPTGAETLLIAAEEINREPHSYLRYPALAYRINNRFFAYLRFVPESCYATNIRLFDVQHRRSIELQPPGSEHYVWLTRIENQRVYLASGNWTDGFILHALDFARLEGGHSPVVLQPIGTISGEEIQAYRQALADFRVHQ
ncbi:MAG: hypothetical protein FWB76_04500 [Oscillospiraceae bacterium]|nr:hypothetical protein [Oscillospiraceae bacterium]